MEPIAFQLVGNNWETNYGGGKEAHTVAVELVEVLKRGGAHDGDDVAVYAEEGCEARAAAGRLNNHPARREVHHAVVQVPAQSIMSN